LQNVGTASTPLLILLALAGGFLFAVICERTRYPSQRAPGQLYFWAAVCAVLLVFLARLVLVVGDGILWLIGLTGCDTRGLVERVWEVLAGELAVASAPTFALAFALAPIAAAVVNWRTDYRETAANARDKYATELELFMDRMSVETKLVYIALKNGKVYVGYVFDQPPPKPHHEEESKYLTLWPQKSGYIDKRMIPQWTTHYSSIYRRIETGEITDLDPLDFEIVVPLDEVLIARAYEQRLEREEFEDVRPRFGVWFLRGRRR
jgi:hypothetical protein